MTAVGVHQVGEYLVVCKCQGVAAVCGWCAVVLVI